MCAYAEKARVSAEELIKMHVWVYYVFKFYIIWPAEKNQLKLRFKVSKKREANTLALFPLEVFGFVLRIIGLYGIYILFTVRFSGNMG
jgi:hypothetical protein